jgi:hypothetical protein
MLSALSVPDLWISLVPRDLYPAASQHLHQPKPLLLAKLRQLSATQHGMLSTPSISSI